MRYLRTLQASLAIAAILLLFIAPVISGSLGAFFTQHIDTQCNSVRHHGEVLYSGQSATGESAKSLTADIPVLLYRLCDYCELVVHLPFIVLEWMLPGADTHKFIKKLSANGEQIFFIPFSRFIHPPRAPPTLSVCSYILRPEFLSVMNISNRVPEYMSERI